MLGFLPPLAPLAVGALDLVGVAIALALLLVMWAGWVFLALVGKVTSNIPIIGGALSSGLDFISGLWKRGTMNLIQGSVHYLEHLAKLAWSVVQVVWRFVYLTAAIIQTLIRHLDLFSQSNQSGLAALQAREDFFIHNLLVQEETDVANLQANMNNDLAAAETFAELRVQNVLAQATSLVNEVQARESIDVAALQSNINQVSNQLTDNLATVAHDLQTNLNNDFNGLTENLATVANNLQANMNQDLATAEQFATNSVTNASPGIIAAAVAQLAPRLAKIETETAECLDPLCDTVTPQAKRLGNLGKNFANLELLGIEALIIALAVECMTDPAGIAHDLETVIGDVGGVVLTGYRDLIGV